MSEPMYIRRAETESIMGDRIVLYYFTNEEVCNIGMRKSIRYAIGIDMYTQLPGERTVRERKISQAVFAKKRDAELFIDILCKGFVTPATLDDIIEDNVIA